MPSYEHIHACLSEWQRERERERERERAREKHSEVNVVVFALKGI